MDTKTSINKTTQEVPFVQRSKGRVVVPKWMNFRKVLKKLGGRSFSIQKFILDLYTGLKTGIFRKIAIQVSENKGGEVQGHSEFF